MASTPRESDRTTSGPEAMSTSARQPEVARLGATTGSTTTVAAPVHAMRMDPKPGLLDPSPVKDAAKDAAPACPHCGAPLIDHKTDTGPKAGAWHCNQCGGCFVHRGSAWYVREGHGAPTGWPAAKT